MLQAAVPGRPKLHSSLKSRNEGPAPVRVGVLLGWAGCCDSTFIACGGPALLVGCDEFKPMKEFLLHDRL